MSSHLTEHRQTPTAVHILAGKMSLQRALCTAHWLHRISDSTDGVVIVEACTVFFDILSAHEVFGSGLGTPVASRLSLVASRKSPVAS